MNYQIISADSHVNEPEDLWQKRLPEKLRPMGYKLVDCDDGGQGWTAEGAKPTSYGLIAVAQTGGDFTKYKASGVRFADLPPGNYDPVEHLKDQDKDGIDASVMYPGQGLQLPQIKDKELRLASYRAYNDWLVEDFASANPKRIIPLAMIPVDDDIDECVAEYERCIRKGHRGAVLHTYPFYHAYTDRHFDPLWRAAEASGFPLHFHRVIAKQKPVPFAMKQTDATWLAGSVLRFFAPMEPICYMVFSGIFHRHPKLKIVSAESEFGWWPFFVQACDDSWERQRHWSKSELTEKPSEYFRRQVYLTFMNDVVGCSNLKFIGTDNFMFATDYPHSVSVWPNSRRYIADQMAGIAPDVQVKLKAGNAVRLYGLAA